jgi:hypothetical protein
MRLDVVSVVTRWQHVVKGASVLLHGNRVLLHGARVLL